MTSFLISILIYLGIDKIQLTSEESIPTSYKIEANNSKISAALNNDIYRAIHWAKKNHEKRTHFLNRIYSILNSYDEIDQFWIRLGIDKKLQINVTPQIPYLILETKNNEKYILSDNGNVLAKNPPQNETIGLLSLKVSEIKINWTPKSSFKINKKISPNLTKKNVEVISLNKNTVNLYWLVNQTKQIYSQFYKNKTNLYLTKVIWDNKSGFQIRILDKNFSLPLITNSSEQKIATKIIFVSLGNENLIEKIHKLEIMLADLNKKNTFPTEIDLDYIDRASFKG